MITLGRQRAYPIRQSGDVGEARRAAVALALALGWDETDAGRAAIVVTEAATNIEKHAQTGEVVLLGADGRVEMIALDRGPGIADLGRAFEDGYSTAGSPGNGLGAIRRTADEVDTYSTVPGGTALLARICPRAHAPASPARRLRTGAICLPIHGETSSGDAWDAMDLDGRSLLLVSDGLGHGPDAATASREAVRIFRERAGETLEGILHDQHAAMRATRGAAVSLLEVVWKDRRVHFCGVGNVTATAIGRHGTRTYVTTNGTVGLEIGRLHTFDYDWPEDGIVVMYSDGLGTHWDLQQGYPGLASRDPALVAAVLYRDHSRQRDDVTVVVAREGVGQ